MVEVSDNTSNDTEPPLLSVLVPVFNEAATVAQTLTALLEESSQKEIIIVDDGSTDATAIVVAAWKKNVTYRGHSTRHIVVVRHLTNLGKGSAIRTALDHATGTFVVVQDADLEVQPACFPDFLKLLCTGSTDFVIGYRKTSAKSRVSLHWLGIRLLGIITQMIYGYQIYDPACCYKMLSLDILRSMQLQAERFEFCPEVLAKACRMKLRISQLPIDYFPRSIQQGKKLRLVKDGCKAILTLLRYRSWHLTMSTTDRIRRG